MAKITKDFIVKPPLVKVIKKAALPHLQAARPSRFSSSRPVAFRPRLTTGLAFSGIFEANSKKK
jgi:hypothetical protein